MFVDGTWPQVIGMSKKMGSEMSGCLETHGVHNIVYNVSCPTIL